MKKFTLIIVASMLGCCVSIWAAQGPGNGPGPKPGGGPGTKPNHVLTAEATTALLTALTGPYGEYAAHAKYHAILAQFGEATQPFARIVEAEQRHIDALKNQCVKYGVPVPEDPYVDAEWSFDTLLDAAEEAVLGEIENAATYELSMAVVEDYSSLVKVFETLQKASEQNHLPAFLKLVSKLD